MTAALAESNWSASTLRTPQLEILKTDFFYSGLTVLNLLLHRWGVGGGVGGYRFVASLEIS